jgi:NodT family efflux transporter outer membrane factor (OMF) lipoprotein
MIGTAAAHRCATNEPMPSKTHRCCAPAACHLPVLQAALRALAVATLLLAGCASLRQPGSEPAPPVPADWAAARASGDAAGLAAWWMRLGSPELAALVERALAGGTEMAAARARLRAARAQRDIAAAALGPSLSGDGALQASRRSGGVTSRSTAASLDAGWEPDWFGSTHASVNAADADRDAAAASLQAVQVQVAAETALAWIELRGTQARLAIARRALASQEHTLRIAGWRAEAGLVTRLDVEQARASAEQTRAQIPALEGVIERGANALAVLTGQPPGALAALHDTVAALPQPPAALVLSFPAEVLRRRPDVQAAEARVRAAEARAEAVDRERWPSLNLGGSIGLNALTLTRLATDPATTLSLAASVSLPVFDGGRLLGRVAAQEAALDEARANHRATVLAALQEVENALVALGSARRQLAAQQAAADAARTATRLAADRYASGLVDFTAVLTTQRTLLGLEEAAAATTAELLGQHVRLFKALGGGWAPEDAEVRTADPARAAARTP